LPQINQALTNAAKGAFLPVRDRDLCQGLIFLDSRLEEPDLESFLGNLVPQDIKIRVLIAARVLYQKPGEVANPRLYNLHRGIWFGQ